MTLTKQRVFSLWEKNVGYYKLESEDLLTAHMQNHIELEPAFECNDCGKEFGRKVQYDRHMKTYHTSANVVTKQYNCEDCPFQGENSLELKKHVQRSRHTPSQTTEKCYTCKQEFGNYWQLMNHRKKDHPSSKTCRYFKKDCCIFDEDTCWYRHSVKQTNFEENVVSDYPCKECDKLFGSRPELMKHKKQQHKESVSKCKDFIQGSCTLSTYSCWFLHEESGDKNETEQVFHMDQDRIPPDYVQTVLEMIKNLSLQIEELKKNATKSC